MRKSILTLILAITLLPMNLPARSVSVIITEQTVNDFLAALGPVKGKGKGAQNIKYDWTVTKPKVDFEPGTAAFNADIRIKTKIITITDKVHGKLKVEYDHQTNKIRMQVVEAKFPIYVKIFGQKIKLATLDIGKYYKPKFEFNGPEPVQKTVSVDLGGDQPRQIGVTVTGRQIQTEKDRLRVSVDLKYTAL